MTDNILLDQIKICKDQKILQIIGLRDSNRVYRFAAVNRITNPKVLASIGENRAEQYDIRLVAIKRLVKIVNTKLTIINICFIFLFFVSNILIVTLFHITKGATHVQQIPTSSQTRN